MTMDVVPAGKPGEARVYFHGKPLADMEVLTFDPAFEEKKLKTETTFGSLALPASRITALFSRRFQRTRPFVFSRGRDPQSPWTVVQYAKRLHSGRLSSIIFS